MAPTRSSLVHLSNNILYTIVKQRQILSMFHLTMYHISLNIIIYATTMIPSHNMLHIIQLPLSDVILPKAATVFLPIYGIGVSNMQTVLSECTTFFSLIHMTNSYRLMYGWLLSVVPSSCPFNCNLLHLNAPLTPESTTYFNHMTNLWIYVCSYLLYQCLQKAQLSRYMSYITLFTIKLQSR